MSTSRIPLVLAGVLALVASAPLAVRAGLPPDPTPTVTATPMPVPTECEGFPLCQCEDVLTIQGCSFGLCPSGHQCVSEGELCGCAPIPTPTPDRLRHFQCYAVRRQPAPDVPALSLDDQFGDGTVSVHRLARLCNPADKNGEDPGAPTDPDHLMAFKIRRAAPRFEPRKVEVTNQLGTVVVEVRRPTFLLVPTAKSESQPVPPPAPPGVDHFKCYKVKGGRGHPESLEVADQFGTLLVDVKRPRWLCNPADKNGEGIQDPAGHLLCYAVRTAPRVAAFEGTIWFANQLAAGVIEARRARPTELCVPSTKRPLPPPTCGNGTLDPGEECDPTAALCPSPDCNPFTGICVDFGCEPDCTCLGPICGNFAIEGGEECDDGNDLGGDGCSDCLLEGAICAGPEALTCASGEFCQFALSICGAPDALGVCAATPTPCTCPAVFDPVCGCDGVTYDNRCEARCAQVSVAASGACPP